MGIKLSTKDKITLTTKGPAVAKDICNDTKKQDKLMRVLEANGFEEEIEQVKGFIDILTGWKEDEAKQNKLIKALEINGFGDLAELLFIGQKYIKEA